MLCSISYILKSFLFSTCIIDSPTLSVEKVNVEGDSSLHFDIPVSVEVTDDVRPC